MSDRRRPGWRRRNVPVPRVHVAALAAGALLHRLVPWPLARGPVGAGVGLSMVGAGALVAGWAVGAAGEVDVADPDELVTAGPYAASRNPMYVGWTVAYVGGILLAGTAWLLVLLPAVLVGTHRAVRREERALERSFGAAYRRYAARVPRYL